MSGQQTPICSNSTFPSTTNGTTAYQPLGCGAQAAWDTTEADCQQPMPCAGTIDYLLVNTLNSVSGYTFTIRKNGISQTLTCALSSSKTASDKTHSFTVVAGDLVSIQCVTGAGAASTGAMSWHTRFTASNPSQSILLSGLLINKSATTRYFSLQGIESFSVTTESLAEQIMPCAGTLQNFYTSLTNAQVADVITITVFKNGVASAISTTYSLTSATQASDTTHSISVVAGDRVAVQIAFTTGTGTTNVLTGIEFDPSVNGQSVGLSAAGSTNANNSTHYGSMGSGNTIQTGETNAQSVIMACTVQNMYAAIPGAGTISTGTVVSTLRKNATNQLLATTITSNNANDTTDTVTTVDGDLLSLSIFNNATGVAVAVALGVVFFIGGATNATYTASTTQNNSAALLRTSEPIKLVSQSNAVSLIRNPMRIISQTQSSSTSLTRQINKIISTSQSNLSILIRLPQLIRNVGESNSSSIFRGPARIIFIAESQSAISIKQPVPQNTNTAQSNSVQQSNIPGALFSVNEGNISSLTKVPEIVYDISQSSTSSIVKQPVTNFSVTEAQFSATLGLAGRSFSASEGSLTNLIRSPQLSRKTIETTSAAQLKFPAHSSITAEGQNAVTVKEPQPGAYVASQSSSGLYNQGFPVSNSATEGSTASIVRSPQSVINIVETVSTLHFKSVSRANAIRQAQLAVINKLLALGYFVGQANSSVRSSQFVSNMDITQGSNANNSQTVSKQIVAEQIQSPLAIKLVAKTLIGTQPQVAFILKCVLSVFGPISQICVAAMIGRGYTPSSLLLFIAQVYADLFDAQTVDDSYIPNTYADDYNITGEKD